MVLRGGTGEAQSIIMAEVLRMGALKDALTVVEALEVESDECPYIFRLR